MMIGAVAELCRFPVKSMLGETLDEVTLGPSGVLGDRAWALRVRSNGRLVSAKKFPRMLEVRATYTEKPGPERRGRVRVELPSGVQLAPEDPDADRMMSEFLDEEVAFEHEPREVERVTIDRDDVFLDLPVSAFKPTWTRETMPDYFQMRTGTFFEIGQVYILATGSTARLGQLRGDRVDPRRFRANVLVAAGAGDDFVEDGWAGRSLRLGESATCGELRPTVWCVTATLAQPGVPRDPEILRALVAHHNACLGVYASVTAPGVLRVGDPVRLA